MTRSITLGLIAFLLTASSTTAQMVIYVDSRAPANGPGHDWQHAYHFLRDAAASAGSGDEIRVAQGVYRPDRTTLYPAGTGSRYAAFQLTTGVTITGGYRGLAGGGNPDDRDITAFATILSGDLNGDDVPVACKWDWDCDDYARRCEDGFCMLPEGLEDNSYHVVTSAWADATVVFDGVTIAAGNADGDSPSDRGGGIHVLHGAPTFIQCTVTGNWAVYGAGMYNDSSDPTLTDCTFSGNSSTGTIWPGGRGAGMYNDASSPTLTGCTLHGNEARQGAGMYNVDSSNPTLINCTISGNRAHITGGIYNGNGHATLVDCVLTGNSAEFNGGMINDAGTATLTNCIFSENLAGVGGGLTNVGTATLVNCTFSENRASLYGGGMIDGNANATLTNCTFTGNMAATDGGGFVNQTGSPTLTNCTFSGNSANSGGGFFNDAGNPTLTNCTFTANSATNDGGGLLNYVRGDGSTLANCIFWGNTAPDGSQIGGSATATYSCVQGGWPGVGNIDADPMFADADGADDVPGTADDDVRLEDGSPCVNAGNDEALPGEVTTDFEGDDRIWNCRVDMGVDETSSIGLDCNANGVADACDIEDWTSADCNSNGVPDECDVFHVDDDAGPGGDGLTWLTAYDDLQDALSAAACRGMQVRMAGGTYRPSARTNPAVQRTATFQLANGVALRGGYRGLAGGGEPNDRDVVAFATILSGDLNGDDVPVACTWDSPHCSAFGSLCKNDGFCILPDGLEDNCYHVVTGASVDDTTVLDGLTIAGGNADGDFPHERGAGVYLVQSDAALIGCTVTGSSANFGAAMFSDAGNPTLTRCTFSDSSAVGASPGRRGGGVYIDRSDATFIECDFRYNDASSGAGLYGYYANPILVGCTFSDNFASHDAGGMRNFNGDPTLINCAFYGNGAEFGGGMQSSDFATLIGCRFSGNGAAQGGGMSAGSVTLINCAFSGNQAGHGGGMSVGTATLTNCTFSGNSASRGGGLYTNENWLGPTLTGCIVSGNTASNGPQIYGATTASYSCIQGGWPGIGNIDADPHFLDADGPDDVYGTTDDNLRLTRSVSPCIDAGDNAAVPADALDLDDDGDTAEPIPLDLDGANRFADDITRPDTGSGTPPVVDMGAYEIQAWPTADINGDGTTSLADFRILLRCMRGPEAAIPTNCDDADVDRDTDVDLHDFRLLQLQLAAT